MKRAHVETLVRKIEDFEKVDEDPNAKCIVMRNFQMLIRIEHYENMRDRCLELEKQLKEVDGEDNVVVQEKSLKTIEAELEHVRKNFSLIAKGKEVEEVVDRALTPQKRRPANLTNHQVKQWHRLSRRKPLRWIRRCQMIYQGTRKVIHIVIYVKRNTRCIRLS